MISLSDDGLSRSRGERAAAVAHGNADDSSLRSKRQRADAVRNRARILNAASVLLADRGLDVTLSQIAAAAGVGLSSVHRAFPTKAALVTAVVDCRGAAVTDLVTSLSDYPLNPAVFQDGVRHLFRLCGQNAVLADTIEAGAATRLESALTEFWHRARTEGVVRSDVSVDDIWLVFCALLRQLRARSEKQIGRWGRAADLFVAALAGHARGQMCDQETADDSPLLTPEAQVPDAVMH